MPGMLAVFLNGFVVVDAVVERGVKIRLPTGEWRLTTRRDDDRSNSRRLYHNDNQGGGGSYYLNGMCRNRLGWTVHCPGTANYWRAHQAPNVDSAYFFAGSPAPAAVHPNRLSRLLGCHGSATLRKATHVAPSHTTFSDWLTWPSYAQHFIRLPRDHLAAQALRIFRPAVVVFGPPILHSSPSQNVASPY